jgi:hypothetical protein
MPSTQIVRGRHAVLLPSEGAGVIVGRVVVVMEHEGMGKVGISVEPDAHAAHVLLCEI